MTVLQTIAVAFAMFSAIPMPQFEWSQKNMRYALCAFPLIGAVCGGLWCLVGVLPVPELVRAAGVSVWFGYWHSPWNVRFPASPWHHFPWRKTPVSRIRSRKPQTA